jgi:DNA-binding transcriptional ArsR family regulator
MDFLTSNSAAIEKFLKTLTNGPRLRLLCALCEGEKNVGELCLISALSQSAVSQHLSRLRQTSLVETRREEQMIYYSLTPQGKTTLSGLSDFLNQCDRDKKGRLIWSLLKKR